VRVEGEEACVGPIPKVVLNIQYGREPKVRVMVRKYVHAQPQWLYLGPRVVGRN